MAESLRGSLFKGGNWGGVVRVDEGKKECVRFCERRVRGREFARGFVLRESIVCIVYDGRVECSMVRCSIVQYSTYSVIVWYHMAYGME